MPMSGPVWRVHDGETVACNECLKEVPQAYVEGEIAEGEYHPRRYLCPDCYPEQISVISKGQ